MFYTVKDKEVQWHYSPIESKLIEYSRKIDKALSFTRYDCSFCGERERGITNVVDGTFKCRLCLLNEEEQRLENDIEMVKKEKIFNMRMARKKHKEEVEQCTARRIR